MKREIQQVLALLLSLPGVVAADEVYTSGDSRSVVIKFDEPVVPLSVVENAHNKNASAEEKGLHLFDLTGCEAAYLPEAYWLDQDRLQLTYKKGFDGQTVFRVAFKEGANHYLSGAKMPKSVFEFRYEPQPLRYMEVNAGLPCAATCVYVNEPLTKAQLAFSPDTPVTYVFREVVNGRKSRGDAARYGRTVPGEATQAQVRNIRPNQLLRAICGTTNFADKKQAEGKLNVLQGMTLDTPVPGYVLVRATAELPGDKKWELCVAPAPAADLKESQTYVDKAEPLRMAVTCMPQEKKDNATQRCLQLSFNAPLNKSDAGEVFRRIEMKIGDAVAVNSGDGKSKTITLPDGSNLTFALQPFPFRAGYGRLGVPGENEDSETVYSYNPPYTEELLLTVSGTASLPQVLDVCLPAGVKAMAGAENKEPERVRLSLTPAYPLLVADASVDSPVLLPACGERKLRVATCNCTAVRASMARFTPEQFLEYADMLSKQEFDLLENYARAQYELARLKTCRAIPGMPMEKNEVSNAERNVRNIRKRMPNLASLRAKMPDICFSPEQELPVTATVQPGQSSGEVVLEPDKLMGGKAAPGFYLVCVRSSPTAEVQEQLRRVGADPATFESEQWFPLLISDLNLVKGTGAVAAFRLSDGAPVMQGELRQQKADPIAVKNGVAVVNEFKKSRTPHRMALCSGEDYNILTWRSEYLRVDDDDRMEILRDRGTYRPGETVHVRGVLRSVSPKGQASLPSERNVTFSVNRPNGTRLLEKTLRVNEYGAFDIDFTLPEGEEDVTGTYRILARCGDFRAYSYVACEVFRRDAFELECKLNVEPVRPKEYSVTIKATDLNGTPLSDGVVQFETAVSLDAPHAQQQQTGHSLTLDKEGKATYTAKLPELKPNNVHNNVWIRGEVRNSRMEVLRLPYIFKNFYPADFTAELRESNDLYLYKVGDKREVLERAQAVHLRLYSTCTRTEWLPNGLVAQSKDSVLVWEGDVTVPAGAVNGVATGLRERWQQFVEQVQKDSVVEQENPRMIVELTATDAAGNALEQKLHSYPTRRWESSLHRHLDAKAEGGNLRVQVPFSRAGLAVVILRSVQGTRVLPPVQVQEGKNELVLPLAAGEEGNVQLCLLLPQPKDGVFGEPESASGQVQVPPASATLNVGLELPKNSVRPNERITLSGCVTDSQGKPTAAQVTLFAVDAGMLSVDSYSVPNLTELFTRVWVDGFNPRRLVYATPESCSRAVSSQYMRGIWTGQWLDAEGRIINRPRLRPIVTNTAAYGERVRSSAPVRKKSVANRMEDTMEADCDMVAAPAPMVEECAEPMSMESGAAKNMVAAAVPAAAPVVAGGAAAPVPAPRVRTNFIPVAVWAPALHTDESGHFRAEVTLPDTLTTYKVFALALGKDGKTFGNGEGEFKVNQPVMLTPGTPFFMSLGDRLRLPVTITNATETAGTWTVEMQGTNDRQSVTLQPGSTATLYFDYIATEEGERKLQWSAVNSIGSDAVEGSFTVRFPAPILKEAHHLVLKPGDEPLRIASLLAPELAGSSRGEVSVQLSANPLLHLYGCMELVQNSGYPCTQYRASSLLAWMLYDRMAPFSPIMAQTEPAAARDIVNKAIAELLKNQKSDGGISYWCGAPQSSPWASAYAGLVLTLAQEQGFAVSADAMESLRNYLRKQWKLACEPQPKVFFSPFDRYAIGRTIGDRKLAKEAVDTALDRAEESSKHASIFAPVYAGYWWRSSYAVASLRFLAEMNCDKEDIHADFLRWMRAVGHDYRHASPWDGGWMLIALHEYLRRTPGSNAESTLTLQTGELLTLGQGMTTISPAKTPTLGQVPTVLTPKDGITYLTVKSKALPEQTEYPGVTEKGLQVTRIYEKKGEDGVWREARDFRVGDVVRVTLTCAKSDRELEYFVLEDYLPACMEAINPNVPSQAAGLEWTPWSPWFDHKEYLAYRVRGFCTRWGGRDLLNMRYYARVKRSGTSIAPPAQAQLMYEPQTYGLSPNTVIISR